jgi:hypothetical protein
MLQVTYGVFEQIATLPVRVNLQTSVVCPLRGGETYQGGGPEELTFHCGGLFRPLLRLCSAPIFSSRARAEGP